MHSMSIVALHRVRSAAAAAAPAMSERSPTACETQAPAIRSYNVTFHGAHVCAEQGAVRGGVGRCAAAGRALAAPGRAVVACEWPWTAKLIPTQGARRQGAHDKRGSWVVSVAMGFFREEQAAEGKQGEEGEDQIMRMLLPRGCHTATK